MTSQFIQAAATLIADIDPNMSKLFIDRPFHRHSIITAMYPQVEKAFGLSFAETFSVFCRSQIDRDQAYRA